MATGYRGKEKKARIIPQKHDVGERHAILRGKGLVNNRVHESHEDWRSVSRALDWQSQQQTDERTEESEGSVHAPPTRCFRHDNHPPSQQAHPKEKVPHFYLKSGVTDTRSSCLVLNLRRRKSHLHDFRTSMILLPLVPRVLAAPAAAAPSCRSLPHLPYSSFAAPAIFRPAPVVHGFEAILLPPLVDAVGMRAAQAQRSPADREGQLLLLLLRNGDRRPGRAVKLRG